MDKIADPMDYKSRMVKLNRQGAKFIDSIHARVSHEVEQLREACSL